MNQINYLLDNQILNSPVNDGINTIVNNGINTQLNTGINTKLNDGVNSLIDIDYFENQMKYHIFWSSESKYIYLLSCLIVLFIILLILFISN
jgi:hypothetical protein